jgi:hypothetical protein
METIQGANQNKPDRYVAWMEMGCAVPATRCYVEDVTRSGAKVSVFRLAAPDEFTLYFNRKGDAKIRCRVTSRAGRECSVEFIAAPELYS